MMMHVECITAIVISNSKIKVKLMLWSGLCNYIDAYILVSGTITVTEVAAGRGNNNMQVIFKNDAPFTDCISEINNIQIDNANVINVVMPLYNLIECSDINIKKHQ